jgi:hypothetical protein
MDGSPDLLDGYPGRSRSRNGVRLYVETPAARGFAGNTNI